MVSEIVKDAEVPQSFYLKNALYLYNQIFIRHL